MPFVHGAAKPPAPRWRQRMWRGRHGSCARCGKIRTPHGWPSGGVHGDDGVSAIGFTRAAIVFDRLAGSVDSVLHLVAVELHAERLSEWALQ